MRAIASWWIAAVLLAATARAERIRWFCDHGSVNLDSSGSAMDAGFQFELGVFDAGFTPTMANRHEWRDHWNIARTTSYNPAAGRYLNEFEVTNNDAPFVVGAEAWVFGRRITATESEWVLFRSPGWVWPEAPLFPDPEAFVSWDAADAGIVPAGEVDAGGTPFLMKSERVVSYAQWQLAALAGEPLDSAGDDPDSDGVANEIEFFCGTDPRDGASLPVAVLDFAGPGGPFLRAAFPMDPGSLVVATVEGSGDLVGWDDAGILLERSGTTLVATDFVTVGSGTPRFLRLRVEMP